MCFCVITLITSTHFCLFYNEHRTWVGKNYFFPTDFIHVPRLSRKSTWPRNLIIYPFGNQLYPGFRPRHSTSLQLARLVEKITRNFGEKRLTGAVFLDVAKAFDTVGIDGLLYKLTLLNFPSYIVHTISSYLRGRTFEASFQTATSSRRGMRAGVVQGPLQSVRQRHALTLAPRRVSPLRG